MEFPVRRSVIVAVASAATLLSLGALAGAQDAQSAKNLELCNGVGSVSLDLQIGGCTAIIESGTLTPEGLAVAYNIRGNAYSKKNEYDRSIQDYDESIRLNPNYAKPFNNRGIAYQKKGQYQRAITDFNEAIKLNPDYAIAFANRAETFQKNGVYENAARDYDEVIRLQPKYEEAIRLQPEMQSEWKRALETVWNERCWTRAIIGQLQSALAHCDEALRFRPNVAAIFDSRGFTYLKMDQWDAAIADYNSALRLEPRLASALYGRGLAKLKKGNMTDGNADIAAASAINGNIVRDFERYGVK
jgi:tetratricopeptide (TPR) repeat protein